GDLVFMHHHAPCMHCAECKRGAYVHCPTWRGSKLDPGGMAEFIRAPAEVVQADAFAVNDLTPEQAVFIEPLGCCVKALGGVRAANLDLGLGAVVGCGVMGLLNVMTARALGVARIVAVEPNEERRRLAVACGAEEAFTPADVAGTFACDFVIIGPGHPDVTRQALRYVRPGGTALLFTPTPTGMTTDLDLGDLYFREISLIPSYSCGPDDTSQAYELLRAGRVCVEGLVTHRFSLKDVQQA